MKIFAAILAIAIILIFLYFKKFKIQNPETEKYLTTIYFGDRSAGKTLHQAKEVRSIFNYLNRLYKKYPALPQAIVYSIQKFSDTFEKPYLGSRLFYWKDADELQYCPRENCWKGNHKHRLHDCYIIFDDMSTILPPEHWQRNPLWMKKMFFQQAHFGIHILGSLVDPFCVDPNFRRCVDVAFRFRKMFGSKRPEEAKPPIKKIWGAYSRRFIKAKDLWNIGVISDAEVNEIAEMEKQKASLRGGMVSDIFRHAGWFWIKEKDCKIYDTLQDIPEYIPKGYSHSELKCIDPRHNHKNPRAKNYCNYTKVYHEII